MRIRLVATEPELTVWINLLRTVFDVQHASPFKPWTRNDPLSQLGCVYLDAELNPADQARIVRATATRLDQHEPVAKPRRRHELS